MVGEEARLFLDESLSETVRAVLNRFDNPDATIIGDVARETGRLIVEDGHRLEIASVSAVTRTPVHGRTTPVVPGTSFPPGPSREIRMLPVAAKSVRIGER